MKKIVFGISLVTIVAAVEAANAQHYAVVDLGPISATVSYEGMALNSLGQAVGYTFPPGTASNNAVSFASGTATVLPTLGGTFSGIAYGINTAGTIVGSAPLPVTGTGQGFIYNPSTNSSSSIGSLAGAGFSSSANSINDSGVVAGSSRISSTNANSEAVTYNVATGTLTALGILPGGTRSNGYVINASGSVAISANTTVAGSLKSHGAVYIPATGLTDVGTIGTGTTSSILSINNSNEAVGYAATGTGPTDLVSWTPAGGIVDLGILPGASYSYGESVNSSGVIVGNAGLGNGTAFEYAGGNFINLNNAIDPTSGWTLQGAYGINDEGYIVGYGLYSGNTGSATVKDAYELVPVNVPEPTSLAVLGLGGAALVSRRRASVVSSR